MRPPLRVKGYNPHTKPDLLGPTFARLSNLHSSLLFFFLSFTVELFFCLFRQSSRQPGIRSHGPRSVSIPLKWQPANANCDLCYFLTILALNSRVYSKTYNVPRRRKFDLEPSSKKKRKDI